MNTILEGYGDPPVKSHLNLNLEEWSRFKLVHPNMYFWKKKKQIKRLMRWFHGITLTLLVRLNTFSVWISRNLLELIF